MNGLCGALQAGWVGGMTQNLVSDAILLTGLFFIGQRLLDWNVARRVTVRLIRDFGGPIEDDDGVQAMTWIAATNIVNLSGEPVQTVSVAGVLRPAYRGEPMFKRQSRLVQVEILPAGEVLKSEWIDWSPGNHIHVTFVTSRGRLHHRFMWCMPDSVSRAHRIRLWLRVKRSERNLKRNMKRSADLGAGFVDFSEGSPGPDRTKPVFGEAEDRPRFGTPVKWLGRGMTLEEAMLAAEKAAAAEESPQRHWRW